MNIEDICGRYLKNYTINSDGTIDVDGDVNLNNIGLNKLPFKFGRVTGSFHCSLNKLTTLEGSPKWVGGDFDCTANRLRTLEGGPEIVIGSYYCDYNNLVNFKGFPEDYDGYIVIRFNPVNKLLLNIVRKEWSKFIYWCNELNVIDDEGNVNEEWLEEVYHKIGIEYENK